MIHKPKYQSKKNNREPWVEIPSTSCSVKPDNTVPCSYLKLILMCTLLLIVGVGCTPAPELKCRLYNQDTTVICEKADGTKILALVWREK
jgi:hypothetical protein